MAGGYFNDGGAVNVELGAHVFASPTAYRRNIILGPAAAPARILDHGGGQMELSVTGQRIRANLGDAERWIYELLAELALSDPGTLGVPDNLGNNGTFGDSVCVGASGEVQAFTFADVRYSFLSPTKSAEPAFGAVPATPGLYAGTSTLQDYAAGGVTLGTHGVSMRIEMTRSYPLREIPRARGARARGPESDAQIRFVIEAALVDRTQPIWTAAEALARSIGPRHVDLTANGNTYQDVVLESVQPGHTDMNHTTVTFEFLQEL